ncbi:carbohydrate ABC transporter permease [Jiangella asiatica]|uniref:Sugar ABC transporter permease n=1 Tax=Jiangella asiatica TaxID=2530372 RepID=A0A4V2Z299_9ACTN|nr:sugar ABC transporter permease [Jiangella asiatica]TDE08018.1 sugar ABC transporter permease [Jiangella asiatica]
MFWPFLLPALVVYTIFMIAPTVASFWVSLYSWDGIGEMKWRGLGNFELLWRDEVFHSALWNTFVILVGVGLAVFAFSFALTMVLRDMAGKRFARAVLFFPSIVSPIVLAIFWGFLFQQRGLLDSFLHGVGFSSTPNLLGEHLWLIVCMGMIWMSTGLYVTIIMAGVDQIPPYLYEECELAGASAWQRFRYVTFPLTWDVISTAMVLWTVSSLKIFDFILAFGGTTNDLPPVGVWNTALFVYGKTFGGRAPTYQLGYASASAAVTLIAIIVLVALLRRLNSRDAVQL